MINNFILIVHFCQRFIIRNMKINELNDYILIKYLSDEEKITHKELSEKIDEYKGKKTSPSNFSNKLKNNRLRVDELRFICDLLGYDLIVEKKEKTISDKQK